MVSSCSGCFTDHHVNREDYWSSPNKPTETTTSGFGAVVDTPAATTTATAADGGFGKITGFGTADFNAPVTAAPVDEDIDMAI